MNDEIKAFCERFNIDEEEFYLMHDPDFEAPGKSPRVRDLLSIVHDYETLSSRIDEIDEIQKQLLERFKIERRNCLDSDFISTYITMLMSMDHLNDLVKTYRVPVYAKHIQTAKTMLRELGEIEE